MEILPICHGRFPAPFLRHAGPECANIWPHKVFLSDPFRSLISRPPRDRPPTTRPHPLRDGRFPSGGLIFYLIKRGTCCPCFHGRFLALFLRHAGPEWADIWPHKVFLSDLFRSLISRPPRDRPPRLHPRRDGRFPSGGLVFYLVKRGKCCLCFHCRSPALFLRHAGPIWVENGSDGSFLERRLSLLGNSH